MKKSHYSSFGLVFLVILSLSIAACDNHDESSGKAVSPNIPVLSNASLSAFTSQFEKDYDTSLNSLLEQFKIAQKHNDEYAFTEFRNNKWTPVYINKKNFYSSVFDQNKTYLETSPIAPLFNRFENLIYIGINLKNGLLDKDQTLIDQALAEANTDQNLVHSIVAASK